jgi:Putative member of DMT superfamily (DUF486)
MTVGWSPIAATALLLAASNLFMTFAWYGHPKYLNHRIWLIAALASWGVALFEYMLHAGQPDRIRRRPQPRATQDHSGSDHAVGVRAVRGDPHAPTAQARLSVGRAVPGARGVLHLSDLRFLLS